LEENDNPLTRVYRSKTSCQYQATNFVYSKALS
jgi:hypothetical protein